MVAYDGTIRNSNRYVVQLLYGEDGMAGEHIEFQDIGTIAPSHEAFNRAFYFDITNERFVFFTLEQEIALFNINFSVTFQAEIFGCGESTLLEIFYIRMVWLF